MEQLQRISFEILEEAEQEYRQEQTLEKLESLDDLELLNFIDAAQEHIEETQEDVYLACIILMEREDALKDE